jgi:hypothetical protein
MLPTIPAMPLDFAAVRLPLAAGAGLSYEPAATGSFADLVEASAARFAGADAALPAALSSLPHPGFETEQPLPVALDGSILPITGEVLPPASPIVMQAPLLTDLPSPAICDPADQTAQTAKQIVEPAIGDPSLRSSLSLAPIAAFDPEGAAPRVQQGTLILVPAAAASTQPVPPAIAAQVAMAVPVAPRGAQSILSEIPTDPEPSALAAALPDPSTHKSGKLKTSASALQAAAPPPSSSLAQMLGAAAPVPIPAQSPAVVTVAGAAQAGSLAAISSDIEASIEHLAGMRDAARSARPEVTLRHGEFGAVSLRVEANPAVPGEWRAVLASRDPGFVPAVQAALAERAVAAASDTSSSGGNGGGRGAEQQGSGQTSGQPSYGSSPGSDQGFYQPYIKQDSNELNKPGQFDNQPADTVKTTTGSASGLFA